MSTVVESFGSSNRLFATGRLNVTLDFDLAQYEFYPLGTIDVSGLQVSDYHVHIYALVTITGIDYVLENPTFSINTTLGNQTGMALFKASDGRLEIGVVAANADYTVAAPYTELALSYFVFV